MRHKWRTEQPYALLSDTIRFYLTQGDEGRADSLLQRARGWDSERLATFYAMVGTEYYRLNRPEPGKRLLRQALQTGRVPPSTGVPAAMLLLREEEYHLAAQLLERVLQIDPSEYMVSVLLALAHTFQGKRKQARRIMSRARYIARQDRDFGSVLILDEMKRMIKEEPYDLLMMLAALLLDEEL